MADGDETAPGDEPPAEDFLALAAKGKEAWNEWRRNPVNKYVRVTFKGVDFSIALGDGIDFSGFDFGDAADFSGCKWRGVGLVRDPEAFAPGRACFRGVAFGDGARFDGAAFGDWADFTGAAFGDVANFHGATFGDAATFGGAAFGDWALFDGAAFGHNARFDGAAFGDAPLGLCAYVYYRDYLGNPHVARFCKLFLPQVVLDVLVQTRRNKRVALKLCQALAMGAAMQWSVVNLGATK